MPPGQIPERDPVSDIIVGSLVRFNKAHLLALEPPDGAQIIASGELIIRYAVRYIDRPHLSIVPGLVALDYGDILTGEAAWEFVLKKSNLHPRADVVGYRNDGHDEMIVVKKLDLAAPMEVLVYTDTHATVPTARVSALIATQHAVQTANVSARLLEHLPRFDSIDDWQANG